LCRSILPVREREYDERIAGDASSFVCDCSADYVPRNPADSVLYRAVAGNLETFLALQRRRERVVPRFVERELREFLDCGVLARGFLRVHCDACGRDRVVAYSCKGRGICSSCCGRRMADTAAHLVDRVLPQVPIRQWVLSFPIALRYRLAYDSRLARDVLRIFIQAVFASLRRRARDALGIRKAQCGAVTFVQRFGGAINLNVHLHSLVLDGVYYEDERGQIRFRRLPPPDNAEVARVTTRIARRIARLLERRGLGPGADPDEADPLPRAQPLLAELYAASVQGRIAVGPSAGNWLTALGAKPEQGGAVSSSPLCAVVSGFNLHANVCIPAKARRQLENLCRYVGRPAVATERLSELPDGRLLYELRHRWRNGATHVVFEPLEFVAKLAALVPPPRFNLVRYHGILSPAAPWRPAVVPLAPEAAEPAAHHGCRPKGPRQPRCSHPRNYTWAELMARVFAVDVLKCDRCSGRMRILAAINSPEAIQAILECLGLPSRAPPISPALLDEPDSLS
jgi:hypothetical protein